MRKLFALLVCAVLIGGNLTVWHLQAEASRRSDERAAALMRQARVAIGGDEAVNAVKNLVLSGKSNRKIKLHDEPERTVAGNLEMALELPNKLRKKFFVQTNAATPDKSEAVKEIVIKRADVLVDRGNGNAEPLRFKIGAGENVSEIIKTGFTERQSSEMARLMLALLLKTPFDAAYAYAGEGNVEGASADIVEVTSENGFSARLYLDRQSRLPLMMTYRAAKPFNLIVVKKADANGKNPEDATKEMTGSNRTRVSVSKNGESATLSDGVETIKLPNAKPEEADFQIRFADYRFAGNLLLPHRLTTSVNGAADEEMTIESYEVNAANLAERFKQEVRVFEKQKQN